MVKAKPDLKDIEPFKTVLSGNREATAKFTMPQLEMILAATLTGMSVDEFSPKRRNGSKRPRIDAGSGPIEHHVPGDAGSAELLACHRLQDLDRDRWRAGLRARVLRAGVGIPPEQIVGARAALAIATPKTASLF